jgi:hypothetical protein
MTRNENKEQWTTPSSQIDKEIETDIRMFSIDEDSGLTLSCYNNTGFS